MARHPAHDEVAAEVARWYREPTPEMGYDLVEGRTGWFNRPTSTGRGRATVRVGLGARDADELVAEAQELLTTESLTLTFDDRATAAALGPELEARGFEPGTNTVYLALVGGGFDATGPEGLVIEEIDADGADLEQWAVVKLQAFADSDDPPAPDAAASELDVRRAEMAGQGRALLARLDGEVVAVCGYYEGEDRFIFLLGTRLAFRHRHIGRALIGHVVNGAASCRSVIINGDEGGRPAALYQRLGFADEVLWQQPWTRPEPADA